MLDKRKFYINGEWVNPYKVNDCEVINPCNEEPFATISLGSKDDTDLAVKAAKTAFESWKETTKEERVDYLEKLLSIYKKRFGEMAEAISLEMGAPMDWATDVQTASGQAHLEDFILTYHNNYISYPFSSGSLSVSSSGNPFALKSILLISSILLTIIEDQALEPYFF